MTYLKSLLTAAAVAFAVPGFTTAALAQEGLTISDPYAITSSAMAASGAAFFVVENPTADADRLLSAASDVSDVVQLHTHIEDANGVMQMVEVPEGFEVPAGGTLVLKRGSHHVMFMGLKQPLKQGDIIKVALTFEKAGVIEIEVPVDLARAAADAGMSMGAAPAEGASN
ncbi:copper chaperone PCu(A)C [Rhodobacter ferrooxidans]|uniref:Copper chaperone PCu(A)C n=1 Tax=Rhodobacter ferrooxidans TaxID=371731 RepID=C8RZT4_9RHOB|nr:copper chaperone PCu(A)C [Rhodobacter sp. SW2]EEW25881.1 protein of unknown function DUF461 [Rhodobacter sp. SW2]